MPKVLMKHEIEAAEIIARQSHILLFDDMGAGKTVSVLYGLKKASEGHTGYKCVLCVPNTLMSQWVNEIVDVLSMPDFTCSVATGNLQQRQVKYNYFSSVKNNAILITNYSFIVKDNFFDSIKANVLILDEGYLIRNKKTQAYQKLRKMVLQFDKVILMSGNVDSFNDKQFYDVVDLILPGEVKKGSKSQIQAELGEKFIFRSLSSIYSIESPEIYLIPQELSVEQKTALMNIDIEENRVSKINKRMVNAFYNKRLSILNSLRIQDKQNKYSAKEKFLLKNLYSISGKFVIYCSDKKFFKLLKSDLNDSDIEYVSVSGEMPVNIRDRNLNLFKLDPSVKCLLLSGVGKFGLNLQVASTVICMGVPKSKFDLDQIIGRLNRINQTQKVKCFIPYHQDSVEESLIEKFNGSGKYLNFDG